MRNGFMRGVLGMCIEVGGGFMSDTKKKYFFIDPDGEPNYPDMTKDICPDCYGDSDPIDDLYYCGQCEGRGWIFEQQIESVYLTAYDIQRWNKEAEEVWGKRNDCDA